MRSNASFSFFYFLSKPNIAKEHSSFGDFLNHGRCFYSWQPLNFFQLKVKKSVMFNSLAFHVYLRKRKQVQCLYSGISYWAIYDWSALILVFPSYVPFALYRLKIFFCNEAECLISKYYCVANSSCWVYPEYFIHLFVSRKVHSPAAVVMVTFEFQGRLFVPTVSFCILTVTQEFRYIVIENVLTQF